ncbi:MAG: molybdopterin-dependent oxidoreductase [Chloroflexi bacterium]|nr:molybdopterin-dependent oxidoreductase [Chloroflexota bacterium]
MLERIPVSCNKDCGGGCPLLAYVRDGRVERIGNNPLGGPYMAGCVKGFGMPNTLYAPDRLTRPLIRSGERGDGQFREATWEEALSLVAEKLGTIRERHGAEAVLHLGGSGSCRGALHHTGKLAQRFLSLFGGYTATTGGYSSAAANFVTPYLLGTSAVGVDPGTLQHSQLIVLWGANIADCRFGCETAARIAEARRRGVPVVVVDPRRSATVEELGTQWVPVHPGTDTALMMAMLYVWLEEGLVDRAFAERVSTGFPWLCQRIRGEEPGGVPRTPEWASARCKTPVPAIVELARLYGRTKPAALITGFSIQRTVGGEDAWRMAVALQVASGNLGRLGGTSGGHFINGLPRVLVGSVAVPPKAGSASIPVLRWPDAILGGRAAGFPSDIKAVYNVGGNYVTEGSDTHKSLRAFAKLEFAVCHDYFLTPTARQCDVVLPATTFLEREDILFPAAGNYLLFSNQAAPPQGQARNDYDILWDLAERLGFGPAFSEGREARQWLEAFLAASEVPDPEEFRRTGLYWGADQMRVGLAAFAAEPTVHPLDTPSGKVELLAAAYAERTGGSALPESRVLPTTAEYPLRLITPKSRYRVHSQNSNVPAMREREEQNVWLHPEDAALRGIANQDEVVIRSAQGRVRRPGAVTERIMPGVVCLLEGVWPALAPDGAEVAGSANVLTSTEGTQPSLGTRSHSTVVEVDKAQP